jgi:hypothetical protein
MKNFCFVFSAICILFSCSNSNSIRLTKVEGSPEYETSKLYLNNVVKSSDTLGANGYFFNYGVENYELGAQTIKEFDYSLANSQKGQHIHVIINNGPYSAKYQSSFEQKLYSENNVVLAFLSRSYHESVKNTNSYSLTQVGDGERIDTSKELLFYSRPKGNYKGNDTEKVLLDFFLVNTNLSVDGNRVKVTIIDKEFIIYEWAPYYIEGLPDGEIYIKLELQDSNGDLIDSPFNPSERRFTLEN